MNREPEIRRVARIATRCKPHVWPWAEENRAEIEANWAKRLSARPKLFNGRVLLVRCYEDSAEEIRAAYFETDFANFLGWRDLGYPDPTIANGFAMGALRGSDGAYICGIMAGGTANGGRIYFPAGTPDPSDLRPDGSVDLAGSVIRELAEETELAPESYRAADHWIVVRQWPAVAFLRPLDCAAPAEAVAARIRANVAKQREPELAGACVIRGAGDIDDARMPQFLCTFFRWAFQPEAVLA